MLRNRDKDTLPDEEAEPEEGQPRNEYLSAQKQQRSYDGISRKISENDLTNPAVGKIILDSLDQCEEENKELKLIVNKFHSVDKEAAVMREQLKASKTIEKMRNVLLSTGSCLIGLSPSLHSESKFNLDANVIPSLSLGVLLFLAALLLKDNKA